MKKCELLRGLKTGFLMRLQSDIASTFGSNDNNIILPLDEAGTALLDPTLGVQGAYSPSLDYLVPPSGDFAVIEASGLQPLEASNSDTQDLTTGITIDPFPAQVRQPGPKLPGKFETSWFGNTWSGQEKESLAKSDDIAAANGKWAGKDIDDIATFKSGPFQDVIATIGLQEEDRSIRLYKEVDGEPELNWKLHLKGFNGGYGVTTNQSSLYFLARRPKLRGQGQQGTGRQQFHYLVRVDLNQLKRKINQRFPRQPFQVNGFNNTRLDMLTDGATGEPLLGEGIKQNVLYNGQDVGDFVKVDVTTDDPLADYPAGISVNGNVVYVSLPKTSEVVAFNKDTLAPRKSLGFETSLRPRRITTGSNGEMWVIERDRDRLNQKREYIVSGYRKTQGKFRKFKTLFFNGSQYQDWKLTDIDYVNKRLLVTDSEHHQVLQLNPKNNRRLPKVVIGRLNGGWRRQQTTNLGVGNLNAVERNKAHLYFPTGIASSRNDKDLIVASNGVGHLEFDPQNTLDVFSTVFLGSTLTKFNSKRAQWAVEGLEFTEISDGDPRNPTRVYTQDSLYRINPNADNQEGSRHPQWRHLAWTANPLEPQHDSRFQVRRSYETRLFRIPGQRSRPDQTKLFMSTWGDQTLTIFRFTDQGQTAVPAMMLGFGGGEIESQLNPWPFTKASGKGKNNRTEPGTALWMWLDGSNGSNPDGKFQRGEFTPIRERIIWNANGRITVSDDGSIWLTQNNDYVEKNGRDRFSDGKVFQLYLDPNQLVNKGVPQYSAQRMNSFSFGDGSGNTDIKGVVYEAETNDLYALMERRNGDARSDKATSVAMLRYQDVFGLTNDGFKNYTVVKGNLLNQQNGRNSQIINGIRHFDVKIQNRHQLLTSRNEGQGLPFFADFRKNNNRRSSPMSFDVEGQYLFVTYNLGQVGDSKLTPQLKNQGYKPNQDSILSIYDLTKAPEQRFLGTVVPGEELGNYNIQIDLFSAPNVRKKDDHYYIFMEGYYNNLGFYYRWQPNA